MSESEQTQLSHNPVVLAMAWLAVGLPLLWGVVQTLYKAALLFK